MNELKEWLLNNMVETSWGDFDGLNDLTLGELHQLLGLVQYAIIQETKNG